MDATLRKTMRRMRSTKPCGPGTPTLVSSLAGRSREATVANKPGTPGRARNKSSNIARGMPDVFGCTCDQLVCVLLAHFLHTRPRVQRRPAFPAPSGFSRADADARLGHIVPRECGCFSLRGAQRRSNPHSPRGRRSGLLRCARNDGVTRQPVAGQPLSATPAYHPSHGAEYFTACQGASGRPRN